MRTFLSYDVEDRALSSKIGDLQDKLSATGADLKLVNPEVLHFTIRFLGEIDEPTKEKVVQAIEGNVKSLELSVDFKGVGVFPNERRISVIWIGIDGASSRALVENAREVNSKLEGMDSLHKDTHEEFNPHVTIARVRTGKNKEELARFVSEHRHDDFGSAKVSPLRLKLSELLPSGPRYSDLHAFS